MGQDQKHSEDVQLGETLDLSTDQTVTAPPVADEIARLEQQPGNDIILDGSASLVQSLMGMGLIDGYRFLVQPFVGFSRMGRRRRISGSWR